MAHPYDYDDEPVYCSTCGRELDPNARFCDNCGAVVDPQGTAPQYAPGMPYQSGPGYGDTVNVPNYLVWAILVTVFGVLSTCCYFVGILALVPGIVAIVFANQVNSRLQAGDYNGAVASSGKAKAWCWLATGGGILAIIGGILLLVIVGVASIFSEL